ncbi:MAG: hypothetical protein HYU63_03470 [Armatimonadetes bacterium]|nr:hypothetical protein [Armatimonadota bacterium]
MDLTPAKNNFKSYLKKLDDYTLPRESTSGDLEASSYFQAGIHAFPMGYALYGLGGGISSIVSSSLGILIKNKTNSDKLGFLIGTLSGRLWEEF